MDGACAEPPTLHYQTDNVSHQRQQCLKTPMLDSFKVDYLFMMSPRMFPFLKVSYAMYCNFIHSAQVGSKSTFFARRFDDDAHYIPAATFHSLGLCGFSECPALK